MKKPRITEGEWERSNGFYKHNHTQNISTPESGILFRSVNMNGKTSEEQRANAKAVSAVPEMIDALMDCYEFVQELKNHGIDEWSNECKVIEALKKAGVTDL